MLRGHRTYLQLFEDAKQTPPAETPRRGRSEQLHSNRNILLIHRYYYYIKMKHFQYLNTLALLETEMFMAKRTIINTVPEQINLLKELNAKKPDISYFRRKYPHLVW